MKPDHYYSKHPQSKKMTQTIQATLKNHQFTFTTSSGVFSKNQIDAATKMLIEQFERPKVKGDYLDLGCGYGPIGITLAKTERDRTVWMVDVNERAIELATENVKTNDVKNAIVLSSDGFTALEGKKFAAIITNPPIRAGKKVIYKLFAESKEHLVEGGELWLVIQKKQGAPSTITYLSTIFSSVETVYKKKGYYIIRARNE